MDKRQYSLTMHDFAHQPNGEPYPHNHEDAMKNKGGGRVMRSAYLRLFGSMKNKMSFLQTKWACNDWGEPEED